MAAAFDPLVHPDSLVGNTYQRLHASRLFDADWPLTICHLEDEVFAVLVDVWGWPAASSGTAARASGIAAVIARHVAITESDLVSR